ncbi:MAG: hypothetical protein CMJ94_12715 [Planctomycetes bacterium]|nr:hypothetical protein [Planctomycetota bacterium]
MNVDPSATRPRLRERLFGVHGPCEMDVWIHWLSVLAALFATATIAGALYVDPTHTLLPILCLALPWPGRVIQRLGREGQYLDIVLRALALGLIPFVGISSALFFPLLLTVLAILFQRHARSDDLAIASFVLSALAAGGVAAHWSGSVAALIAAPNLCLAATGILWVQARHARRQVRRGAHLQPEESERGLRGRALIGCAMGVLLLLLVPASFRASTMAQESYAQWFAGDGGSGEWGSVVSEDEGDSGSAQSSDSSSGSGRSGSAGSSGSVSAAGNEADSSQPPRVIRRFPDSLDFLGASSMVRGEQSKRLELRVVSPRAQQRRFSRAAPAYLMTTTYDGFGPEGLLPARYDPRRRYGDADDGARDGWTQVVTDPLRGVQVDLQVAVSALRAPGSGSPRLTIPRIEPMIAARRAELEHRAAGMVTVPDDGKPIQEFTFRTRLPFGDVLSLRRPVFDRSDRRFLRLPSDSAWRPTIEALRTQIDELDAGEEVLRAVLGHFKRGYSYSLSAPDPGLEGLASFLAQREGYCTYFATSAMLMLRMLDVPARVAAGYRVTEWDPERGAYVAGDQAAHAWVEVRLVGEGWVPIDPTPTLGLQEAVALRTQELRRQEAAERAAAALAEEEAAATEANDPLADPSSESALNDAADPALDDPSLDPEAAAEELATEEEPRSRLDEYFLYFLIVLLIVITMRGLMKSQDPDEIDRVPQPGTGGVAGSAPLPEMLSFDDDYRRVVGLLQRLGFRPGGLRTPLEFSRRFIERFGARFRTLLPITQMLYARRYGERPMSGHAWERFLQFEEVVERATEEEDWSFYLGAEDEDDDGISAA